MIRWFKRTAKDEDLRKGSEAEAQGDQAKKLKAQEEKDITQDRSAGEAEQEERRKGFLKQLRDRLRKTRELIGRKLDRITLGRKTIDDDLLEELEEVLITSDLGVRTTMRLIERLKAKVRKRKLVDPGSLRQSLTEEIRSILQIPAPSINFRSFCPFVILVVGVNGVGKTTTIGKLAHILKKDGLKVLLVAADTFRAAAIEQLELWADRVRVPVVKQRIGADPSAVVFDALDAAISRQMDVVIIDTAGRMHTKTNLMEELKKIKRVIEKKIPGAPHEVLLILDATTGQNALSQARMFQEALSIDGLIITKLDGTAKGGIVVGICEELKVPVRYIGIGEGEEDLRPFNPDVFAAAIFD